MALAMEGSGAAGEKNLDPRVSGTPIYANQATLD